MMQTLVAATPAAPDAVDQDLLALERRAAKIRRRKFLILLAQVGVLVGSLAAWQIFSGIPGEEPFVLIDKYFVSEPSEVLTALTDWINQGILLTSIISTANVTLLGLASCVISGMLVGFALGVNPTLSAILNPFVSALYHPVLGTHPPVPAVVRTGSWHAAGHRDRHGLLPRLLQHLQRSQGRPERADRRHEAHGRHQVADLPEGHHPVGNDLDRCGPPDCGTLRTGRCSHSRNAHLKPGKWASW